MEARGGEASHESLLQERLRSRRGRAARGGRKEGRTNPDANGRDLHSFVVTSLGRFKCPASGKYRNALSCKCAGTHRMVSTLVILAYSESTEVPIEIGRALTVDHEDWHLPFRNRPENLQWATRKEQMANRVPLPSTASSSWCGAQG
jgi:hypothetical protein